MFATVLLGKLDLETGEFIYCNAGHPFPFIVKNDSRREELLAQSQGIPVGIKRNITYSEKKIYLSSGDLLFIFTDGVTDQNDEHGKIFGIERLIATVKHMHDYSAQDIVNKVIESLKHFQGNAEVHDDITLVAIKYFG
jgi:sigma-B regulation protein RsbU (phosphoserine phosphatase)